jgi:hypothetical protein
MALVDEDAVFYSRSLDNNSKGDKKRKGVNVRKGAKISWQRTESEKDSLRREM